MENDELHGGIVAKLVILWTLLFTYTTHMHSIKSDVCIVGGGPAGIMLGYLLARSGSTVSILEKWDDFFRDFRGDTIHPSTMMILEELGLLKKFLKLPVNKTKQIELRINDEDFPIADFTHLKKAPPFLGFIPQWDFLNFLAEEGKKFEGFNLHMATEATDLIYDNDTIIGVVAKQNKKEISFHADLVIAADGRKSTIRTKAKLPVVDRGAPIDVLWFELPQIDQDTDTSLGYAKNGKMFITLDRDTYWQCAYIIPKGGYEKIKKAGLADFKADLLHVAPNMKKEVAKLASFNDVKLLTVAVDYLPTWYQSNRLLCIGDAAHAMSPVAGVGVNLAIQDAVATANILTQKIKAGSVTKRDLQRVQRRRAWPSNIIQKLQVLIHHNIIVPTISSSQPIKVAWQFHLFKRFPILRRIPAWVIGMGLRQERVKKEIL